MGQACGHSILCRSQQYPAARPAEPRGQQVFLKPDEPPPQPCADSLQDALLSLGAVIDIAGLRQAARDALSAVLPKVETVYTYLLDGESRLVCEDPPHELPQEGKIREAVISQKRLSCNGLGPSDLLGKPLARLVAPLAPDMQVLVIPLLDKETGSVAAVILVHCGQLSDSEEQSLQVVEKHALVALRRVQALQQRRPEAVQNTSVDASEDQKVFDGGVVDDESYEIRIPADQGIAGHVATTGQILNIPDAYAHPLFYRGVDDSTGFRTRNILCFPIKNENQEVIGVAELVNKINGPWSSKFDEDLATAFSIYCGISIAHSLLYKKVNEAQYRSHLANEMMMYHMKVSDDEYTKLLHDGIQPVAAIDSNFANFTYTPRSLPEDDTSMAILSMLQDMNFINNYKIDCPTLARFCLMVKKGYRDPPYHNWMHAFSVSHFCYLLYKNLELSNYLEDIEIFALFISLPTLSCL